MKFVIRFGTAVGLVLTTVCMGCMPARQQDETEQVALAALLAASRPAVPVSKAFASPLDPQAMIASLEAGEVVRFAPSPASSLLLRKEGGGYAAYVEKIFGFAYPPESFPAGMPRFDL